MIVIDKLCYLSKLRYVNPAEKFAFAMATLIICIVSRSVIIGLIAMAVNSLLTIKAGGINGRRYAKLMLVPLAFLVLSTAAIIVNISKVPLDAFAIPAGNWYITGSFAGIRHALQLIATALSAVSCLYFLSLNTTMTDILSVFRKLHCPALVVELMMLIYRFIFVLLDIAYYISTAQDARLGHKNYRTSMKSFSGMVQALFIRAMKRSGSLYDAMEARCYDGEIRVLEENHPAKKRNIMLIAAFEFALLGLTIWLKLKG